MAASPPTPPTRRGMPPLVALALALGLGALVVVLVRRAVTGRAGADAATAGPDVSEPAVTDAPEPAVDPAVEPQAATG